MASTGASIAATKDRGKFTIGRSRSRSLCDLCDETVTVAVTFDSPSIYEYIYLCQRHRAALKEAL